MCLRSETVSTEHEESSALANVNRVWLKVNPLMTPVCPAKAWTIQLRYQACNKSGPSFVRPGLDSQQALALYFLICNTKPKIMVATGWRCAAQGLNKGASELT